MRKQIYLITMMFTASVILTGCFSDTSTRRRSVVAVVTGSDSNTSTTQPSDMVDTNSFASTTTTASATSTSSSTTTTAGYEHCNFNDYSYYVSAVGSVIACQNSSTKTKVEIKINQTNTTEMTCFIPTYRDSSGSSFYIGPAQCLYHNADTLYEGTFTIDRYGYTSSHFNGLMIMKYGLTDDYFNCMLGYTSCTTFRTAGGYIDYPF